MENTNPWTQLFGGAKLLKHDGDAVDPTTFTSKSGVMIYFSAHWCPPCRGFTPQLAEYYKTKKDQHNFEIVFASSDRSDDDFNKYWAEMPWLALPYKDREQKEALSKKYKVQGIPTLVVLDNNGNTITTGGRGKVASDPDGFPWQPKTLFQILESGDGNVLNGKSEKVGFNSLKDHTALGLYFSAHWCPPCRDFTPKLVQTYNKVKGDGKKLEIIFVTSDKDEESFKEYFAEMPWLALPFSDKRISELSDLYGVEGIPTFVIVDPATGKTINEAAKGAVSADPQGAEFPWNPKPLNLIDSAGGILNEAPCLIYLDSTLSDETKSALNQVATQYTTKWKQENKDDPLVSFFYGTSGGMAQRVLEFTNIKDVDPALLILDLPEGAKYVQSLSGKPDAAQFTAFVEGFLGKTLTKKGIKE